MQTLREGVPVQAGLRPLQGGCGRELLLVQVLLPQQGQLPQGQGGRREVRPRGPRQCHRPALLDRQGPPVRAEEIKLYFMS